MARKKKTNTLALVGRICFVVGLIISIAAGWVKTGTSGLWLLLALGIIVGLLNVTGKETNRFLLATLVLLTAGLAMSQLFGETVARVLTAYITFTGAAGFIVALKEVFTIQRD